MNNLKNDIQFILQSKSIANSKENLENSFNDSLNNSDLNSFVNSTNKANRITGKYNLLESLDNTNFKKFQDILNTYNHNKNILLLVDNKNNIWELLKRNDLSINNLSTIESISTLVSIKNGEINNNFDCNKNNNDNNNCHINQDKLLDIEIKENEEKSFINSELEISKVSDFNISVLIKDTPDDDDENMSEIN